VLGPAGGRFFKKNAVVRVITPWGTFRAVFLNIFFFSLDPLKTPKQVTFPKKLPPPLPEGTKKQRAKRFPGNLPPLGIFFFQIYRSAIVRARPPPFFSVRFPPPGYLPSPPEFASVTCVSF